MKLKGFKENTGISFHNIIKNRNLFPYMFEWIESGLYKKTLHYNSLWVDGTNYSPHFVSYDEKRQFYYRGEQHSIGFPMLFGFIYIPFPEKCIVTLLAKPSIFPKKDIIIPDDTDVLEIDFSPEAIERGEKQRKEEIRLEKEKREQEEFEKMKEKILASEKRKRLKEAVLKELKKEGKI